jgi:hypothetical protein
MGKGLMRASRNARVRGGWRAAWLTLLTAVALPTTATATVFSFGTVNATDVITSLTLSPSATKTTFDPLTGIMHVEAFLVQINFSNRPNITGIAADTVLFTSDIMLVGGSFAVTESSANNPRSFTSGFTNGALLDLSIFDTIAAISLLDADYIGPLTFSGRETGTVAFPLVVQGELTGDLNVLTSGDADFRSAFGPLGQLDANYASFQSDGANVGNNLCNLVKGNATIYGTTACGSGGYALDDFVTNTNMTIIPIIPEPGTAVLFGLGLIGAAALRRK